MDLKEGKNYKEINQFGVHYDLINPSLGEDYPIRIYNKFDLIVDNVTTESLEDYWIVMKDLDGETFAQSMNACILAEKLLSGGFLPFKNK